MNRKNAWILLAVSAVLLFAFCLRRDAFWLPHWKGDQSHYAVLAMKLDKQGFAGYNLREVNIGNKILSEDPPVELVFFRPGKPGDQGDLLRVLTAVGQGYYDEPLHFRAPLFSWILMESHRFFAGDAPFYVACASNLGEKVRTVKPRVILQAQFWAAAVPVFFNLCVILLTFFLGWKLYDEHTGLWAAFLMASNPVGVTLAYRLLCEDAMVFFLALSVLLYLIFYPKKNFAGLFSAGVAAGLAILSKQTAGLILIAVGGYTIFLRRGLKFFKRIFSPELIIYGVAAILVSAPWFWKVYRTFGTPLHIPGSVSSGMSQDVTGWFQSVSHRPPPFLFFSIGVIFLSPLLGLALGTLRSFSRQISDAEKTGPETLLWLWVLVFFFFITEPWHILELLADQEHRFFYMAYPALAILAASVIERLRLRWNVRAKNPWIPYLAVLFLFGINAWWGIPAAMKSIFQNNLLF